MLGTLRPNHALQMPRACISKRFFDLIAGSRCPPSPTPVARMAFAIFIAGEPDPAVCDRRGTFADQFLELLREEGKDEQWQLFFTFKGDLPSAEQLAEFDGYVITGSVADAFSDEPWLVALRQRVKEAMALKKRVLGVCFGHQLVGVCLGAPVGRAGCWEVGARQISVEAEARSRLEAGGAAWAAQLPDSLCLHVFHQDQVLELPKGATLLASSERCPVEMFAVGDHVLCIQGHPEFDREVVELLAAPRLEKIGEADVARMNDSLAALPVAADAGRLRALCRAFLKGRP